VKGSRGGTGCCPICPACSFQRGGNNLQHFGDIYLKAMAKSGLDCLICADFAVQKFGDGPDWRRQRPVGACCLVLGLGLRVSLRI
jgi:hypothetical protein